jgi:hypothetical protein
VEWSGWRERAKHHAQLRLLPVEAPPAPQPLGSGGAGGRPPTTGLRPAAATRPAPALLSHILIQDGSVDDPLARARTAGAAGARAPRALLKRFASEDLAAPVGAGAAWGGSKGVRLPAVLT